MVYGGSGDGNPQHKIYSMYHTNTGSAGFQGTYTVYIHSGCVLLVVRYVGVFR